MYKPPSYQKKEHLEKTVEGEQPNVKCNGRRSASYPGLFFFSTLFIFSSLNFFLTKIFFTNNGGGKPPLHFSQFFSFIPSLLKE